MNQSYLDMNYKQMAWLELYEGASNKVLHLRADSGVWMPYTSFSRLCKPDLRIRGASQGYPTMQHLLAQGWQLLSSEEAKALVALELAQ